MPIRNDISEKLANHHKRTHPEYLKLLTKTPTIIYAIDYELLPSNKLAKPKQIHEIREYFASLGWDFKSSSLSNALRRKSEQIEVVQILIGRKRVNLYSQKDM